MTGVQTCALPIFAGLGELGGLRDVFAEGQPPADTVVHPFMAERRDRGPAVDEETTDLRLAEIAIVVPLVAALLRYVW